MKRFFLAWSLILVSYCSFGAAYQINIEGLRQLAMGGSGASIPWDASTMFYNPAGLVRLKNIQIYSSVAFIMPATGFSNANASAQTAEHTFTPINLYIGGPIREGSRWALGLGIYSPAGNGIQWPDNWTGRMMVQSINMSTYFIQPTVSYKIGEVIFLRRLWNLSAGLGLIYAGGSFDYSAALPVQGTTANGDIYDGTVKLHANPNGVGFNGGLHLKYGEGVSFGLTYRSQVNMNIDGGSAKFNVPQSLNNYFPSTTFTSNLPIPQVLTFGIGLKPSESFTLQLELNYTGWNSFDSMYINYTKHTSMLSDTRAPRKYENTFTPRIGANCKVARGVAVMAGFAFDPTPVKDGIVSPDLPDADRYIVSCGASVKLFPHFTAIAAFESITSVKRAANYVFGNFNGTYQTTVATPAIGFYYNF
jgi:long-chain fatty acid transport protein